MSEERLAAIRPARGARVEELSRRFAPTIAEIARDAAENDRERRHPFELVRRLASEGFALLRVPERHGGIDVSLSELAELLIDLGAADASVPNALRGHFSFIEILRQTADERIRSHWFSRIAAGEVFGNGQTEPVGSDPTTVRPDGDGWVVDGAKAYSSGALYADAVRVSAFGPDGDRLWAIVPTAQDGVELHDDWEGFGQRLSASGTAVYRGARAAENGVFPLGEGTGQHMSFVQLVHLATLAGIARRIVTDAVELLSSRRRTGFHALDPLPVHDADLLGVVGRLSTHALVAEQLAVAAARRLDEANARREALLSEGEADAVDDAISAVYAESYVLTSQAQLAVIEQTLDAATELFDLGGSSAVGESLGLDRHWRNARTIASHNPRVYKPHVIGDYLVNGALPETFWRPRAAEITPGVERIASHV